MKRTLMLTFPLSLAVGSIVLASCGGKTAGEQVRPKDQTYSSAMGETTPGAGGSGGGACHEPESGGEPLVVDWKPEQRGDLEALMKESVAIVSYSCKGFKLLKDCKVDGNYKYLGITKKEQVVRLTNADEVKANLPLGGIGIAGKIGAEMNRGSTLDVALVMVGKVKTTNAQLTSDMLASGADCEGATHFVRGAVVGAFVMQTGTKGDVKTAAQLFSAGGSAGSSSEKSVQNKDGEFSDCGKASPDAKTAPEQCRALVRLELKAIAPKGKAGVASPAPGAEKSPPPPTDVKAADVAEPDPTCPKGLVLADGKCTEPKGTAAYLCAPRDGKECQAQCAKGHAGSCGVAGALFARGGGGLTKDEKQARELLAKACDGGDAKSCSNVGVLALQGRGGGRDAAFAVKHLDKGCADGDGTSCGMLGVLYNNGEGVSKDAPKAVGLLEKGCDGGYAISCAVASQLLIEGAQGVTKDEKKGLDFAKRACSGNEPTSCYIIGSAYDVGSKDTPKNAMLAKQLYFKGCLALDAKACVGQGRLELGQGGSQEAAKRAFDQACTFKNDSTACAAMKVLFGSTKPFIVNAAESTALNKSCGAGNARDCAYAGTISVAQGNKAMGLPQIERACNTQQDPLACEVKKKVK